MGSEEVHVDPSRHTVEFQACLSYFVSLKAPSGPAWSHKLGSCPHMGPFRWPSAALCHLSSGLEEIFLTTLDYPCFSASCTPGSCHYIPEGPQALQFEKHHCPHQKHYGILEYSSHLGSPDLCLEPPWVNFPASSLVSPQVLCSPRFWPLENVPESSPDCLFIQHPAHA